jgi:hypothetical protein
MVLPAWTETTSSSSSSSGAAGVTVTGQGAVLLYDFASCKLLLTVGPGVGAELLTQLETALAKSAVATSASADALAKYTPAGFEAAQASSQRARSCAAAGTSSGCSDAGKLHAGVRQLQGQLRLAPGQPLQLRLLMDFSLLEVFCGDGQVMSTRLYRGVWPSGSSGSSRDVAEGAAHGDVQAALVPAIKQELSKQLKQQQTG